jgi:protein-S-isoprenylcysteine O-methyltransferase Ste14
MLLFLGVFFRFGYDMKERAGWSHLAPARSTRVMKIVARVLAAVLVLNVFLIREMSEALWLTWFCFAIGCSLVRAAKLELEKHGAFTWTGYVLEKPALVTTGPYAHVRHPLYLGVFFTEVGGVILVLGNVNRLLPESASWVTWVLLTMLAYAFSFNLWLARKESRNLARELGRPYIDYADRVAALIPMPSRWLPLVMSILPRPSRPVSP